MTRNLAILVLGMSMLIGACSTSGRSADPVQTAFETSQKSVSAGVKEGFEESESVGTYTVNARLNRCRCEAPAHEIYVHGRWTRVFLDGDQATLAQLDKRWRRDRLARIDILGRPDGDRASPRGIGYGVFEIKAIK